MLSKLDVKAGTPAPARWVGWRPAGPPRRLRAAAPVQRGAVCDECAGRAADGDAGGRDAYHVPALRAPAAGLAGARGAPAAHGRPQVQTSTALARLPSIMWPNPLARERVRRGRVTCLCQRTVGALPCASRQPALKQASTERRRPHRHRAAGLISGRGRAAGGGVWHRGPERGQDADAVRVPGLPAREPGAAAQQPRHRQDVQGAAARARQAPGRLRAHVFLICGVGQPVHVDIIWLCKGLSEVLWHKAGRCEAMRSPCLGMEAGPARAVRKARQRAVARERTTLCFWC